MANSAAVNWEGYYVGASAGARAATAKWDNAPGFLDPYDYSSLDARVGLHAGYGWQVAPRWIGGIEAEIGFGDQNTRQANFFPGFAGTVVPILPGEYSAISLGWDANLRARLGYLITPTTLAFATAGLAWQHVRLDVTCISVCGGPVHGAGETVRQGWTIGGGFETALTGNWFARAEYRYADFGAFNIRLNLLAGNAGVPVDLTTHTVSAGLTYRFGAHTAPRTAAWLDETPVERGFTGAHVGVAGGMRFADASWRTQSLGVFPIDETGFANYNGAGFRLAGLAGYDWQIAPRWIAGVEGEAGFADRRVKLPGFLPGISGSLGGGPILAGDTSTVRTDWDASIRARLGYLLRPSMLIYATGGVAWMGVETNSTCGPFSCFVPESSTDSETLVGWTLGGGAEVRLLKNWRIRTEYRYADFGTMRANFTYFAIPDPAVVDIKVRTHTAQLALIYDWN